MQRIKAEVTDIRKTFYCEVAFLCPAQSCCEKVQKLVTHLRHCLGPHFFLPHLKALLHLVAPSSIVIELVQYSWMSSNVAVMGNPSD